MARVIRKRLVPAWVSALALAALVWACTPPPPPLPIAVDDTFAGSFDAELIVAAPGVLANDTVSGGSADAGARATAAGGTADLAADGGFSYVPAPGHYGTDTFTYTVTNVTGTSSAATVTIEVPAPPSVEDDAYVSTHDAVLAVPVPGVLANDTARGGSVDAGVRSTTGGGIATLFANGSFTYQPAPGYGGVDTFTYTVTNGFGTSTPATVTIEVPAALWVTLPDLPIAVSRSAGAVVDGSVFVFGGEADGGLREGRLFSFDRSVGDWVEGDAMPTPGSNLCAVVVGTRIFVPGGWTGTAAIGDLQVYDVIAGTWSVVDSDPLPSGIFGHTCASHEGLVYVLGGSETGIAGTTVWRYDPEATPGARWDDTLAALPIAVHYPAAIAVGDDVFVLGGNQTDSADVLAYDPASDEWTAYPSLTAGRGGLGAWVSGPYLYAGGGGWYSYLTSVERYDTRLGVGGAWATVADLSVGRRTFAYASDLGAGWLYAVGGYAGVFLDDAEEGLLNALVP